MSLLLIAGASAVWVALNAVTVHAASEGRIRLAMGLKPATSFVNWFGTGICLLLGWEYGSFHGWAWGLAAGFGSYFVILRGIQQIGSFAIMFVVFRDDPNFAGDSADD